MNKTDFIKSLVEKSGQDKKTVESVLSAIDEVVKAQASIGDSVPLAGLGTYKDSNREAREARNPMTGETVHVPAKKVAKFAISKSLKEIVASK